VLIPEPLQETQTRLRSERVRRLTSEIILPVTILSVLVVVGSALLMGAIDETAGLALGLCLLASVGGGVLAVLSIRLSRHLGSPDPQRTNLHPGWFRYGPVGGVGGVVAILGFVVTSLLRAPLFIPVFVATAVLGACFAIILRRARGGARREDRPSTRS
jgi:hypothetical protein